LKNYQEEDNQGIRKDNVSETRSEDENSDIQRDENYDT